MGVRGLLTYLKKHPEVWRHAQGYSQSLSTIAKERPKILCDFLNIFYWLLTEFHEAKVKCGDYQTHSSIYGGNLIEYQERFMDFVQVLKHVGVDPIFFVDGDKGSNLMGFQAKYDTYQKRHEKQIVVHYDPKKKVDSHKTWIPPPLLVLHILMSLKSEGIELKHTVGEADAYMAEYARQAEGVCGILTNDTDMVIMRGCEVFLCAFFDREAKLGIRNPERLQIPYDVRCEIVTSRKIAQALEIPESDLINLSIICGNDYTGGLNSKYELIKRLKFQRYTPKIQNIARWLRTTPHSQLHETSPLKEICEECPEYKQAIDHTYHACEECPSAAESHEGDSQFYNMVLSEVKEGKMTRNLLPMAANSIYWRDVVVEDVVPTAKCIGDLLLPIRQLIYRLLGLSQVKEYGGQPLKEILVAVHFPNSTLLPHFRTHSEVQRVCLLATFLANACFLVGDPLTEFRPDTFDRCDTEFVRHLLKPLIVCASLLFSRSLKNETADFNLECVPDVYLITCCMCCLNVPLRKVHSKPSSTAINVANGFACIIKHSYDLASLFGLLEVMPLPGQVYQSAALIPYFQVAEPSSNPHLLKVREEMAETSHAYKYITQQLQSFKKLKALLMEALKLNCAAVPLQLAEAFMEAMVEIDKSNKENLLFVPITAGSKKCKRRFIRTVACVRTTPYHAAATICIAANSFGFLGTNPFFPHILALKEGASVTSTFSDASPIDIRDRVERLAYYITI